MLGNVIEVMATVAVVALGILVTTVIFALILFDV